MPSWIDTHAHLDDERFRGDFAPMLQRAADAGLVKVLTIGIDLETSRASVELAKQHALLVAVVGIQPNHVAEAKPDDFAEIVKLAEAGAPVVAIGESGLDRYWDRAPFPMQEDYFARHLELARRLALPIVIHNREADADCVRMLEEDFRKHGPVRGVMHSFAADAATAEACLKLGLHISFAGMLTYKTADDLRKIAATIPAERLLVETDSPYLAPQPVRGKRNEPGYVIHTGAVLAASRNQTAEEIAAITTRNAMELFRLNK